MSRANNVYLGDRRPGVLQLLIVPGQQQVDLEQQLGRVLGHRGVVTTCHQQTMCTWVKLSIMLR